jgi:hypothetical protein
LGELKLEGDEQIVTIVPGRVDEAGELGGVLKLPLMFKNGVTV